MSQETLKGKISYNKYIWVTSEGACEKCQTLDGEKFTSIDDIPDIPHPNCKCYIDIIDENDEKDEDDNEPCDCWEKTEKLLDNTEEAFGEATTLIEECQEYINDINVIIEEIQNKILENIKIAEKIKNIKNKIANKYTFDITNDKQLQAIASEIFKHFESANNAYKIFEENKTLMEEKKGHIDKYYHAKANCESAELGVMEAIWAVIFSVSKEIKDYYVKVFILHKDAVEIYKDCLSDLEADRQGLIKAYEEGECSKKVEDVENYFKHKK